MLTRKAAVEEEKMLERRLSSGFNFRDFQAFY
jgi:hypothetical protein